MPFSPAISAISTVLHSVQCYTLLLSDSDYPLFSEPAAYLFIVLSITFKVRILTARTQLLSN